ncbi:hypothetical protein NUU61_004501 [Penicillium alfredii]|uniref:CFEM domain-containing protein n=1 Tax=Penicillium alfredii TaxID=1506179 RepID=A0A9W9FL77_9EURO|nr:uncharacterized protein NUU61_004501 [Penicillium alfredii]KAJ5102279.1 hypothetical protein NUU61_004501 [Penicillium alfredii]
MHFSHALVALVAAGLANAQLPDVPECSLNCFVEALTGDGCSKLTDFSCHCQKTELVSTVTPCVKKACEVADQIAVSKAVVSQCSSAGHPIVVPPVETGSASSDSSSTTGSNSTPAETTATATTLPGGSVTVPHPTVPSPTGHTSHSGSSTPLKPTKTGGSGSGGSGSGSGSGSGTESSPGASTSAYNGASSNKGNLAGVAAVAAAAAYLL